MTASRSAAVVALRKGATTAATEPAATPTAAALNAAVSPRILAALMLDRADVNEGHRKLLQRCIAWNRIPAGDALLIRALAVKHGLIAEG